MQIIFADTRLRRTPILARNSGFSLTEASNWAANRRTERSLCQKLRIQGK
jgi:hypothetical protein